MARKVFISVLGTSLYEKCKYVSGRFCSSETNFIQLATLEYLQHLTDWSSDSKAYFLLTEKAMTENWEVKNNQRFDDRKGVLVPYRGLKHSLESASLPFSFEEVCIPNGKNGDEMWEIFEKTYRLIEDGDELYFDLTHSFRYLPMLILVLGNYAKFLKNAKVCSITYGNYEARNKDNNEAPIVDLLPLSSLQDWTFATADFLKNGYTDRLVELSGKGLAPLLQNDETRTDETVKLKGFVNHLNDFSLEMQTCRGLSILEATSIEKTRTDIESLQEVVIPQLKPVLYEVQKSIEPFKATNVVENILKAALWCYHNQQYQQAITFLEEGIISYFCVRHDIPIDDRLKRELITSAFNILAQSIPKGKWRVSNPEWIEQLDGIVGDELLDSFVKDFSSVSSLRNDYNHCGMRVGALKSRVVKEKVKKNIDTIISRLPFPIIRVSVVKRSKDSAYLINFSNHPSECWGQAQLDAGREYGEIKDIPFPVINPDASFDEIQKLAERYTEKILSLSEHHQITVHIMGEMTFTYLMVTQLKGKGIECIASTSDRNAEYASDGKKISDFHFVQFRKY